MPERPGSVLGLHLGMSGRVLIDGEAAGDPLVYASNRAVSAWHRFGLRFADGGSLYLRDPRRLGAVELDPDEERLGPDAFDVTLPYLRDVLSRSRAPVKAVIMDQSRIAGLGNLLCDEALWRAGIDPARAAEHARRRRGPPAPPRDPRHAPGPRPSRRVAHRRPHVATGARRALPEGRRAAAATHDRRPHDLLVPAPPALIARGTNRSDLRRSTRIGQNDRPMTTRTGILVVP